MNFQLSRMRQHWSTRTSLRLRGSRRERVAGSALYVVGVIGPLTSLCLQAETRLVAAWTIGSLVFIAQGTTLLFTVPVYWHTAQKWLQNRLPAWLSVLLLLALGLFIVLPGADGQGNDLRFVAVPLAVVLRATASLTEPEPTTVRESQVLWRLRRAALIHAGFMPVFAFGVMAIVASVEHARGQQVPFTWPAAVIVAAAAFIFKVHQRMRKVCTQIAGRVAQVQTALGSLGTSTAVPTVRNAITELEAALRTPVQTGYHMWGTPIVPAAIRQQLIDWLDKRLEDHQPVSDSSDSEYQALNILRTVCSRWTDVAA